MRLTLIAPVPAVAADLADDKRTITGVALPYGVVGRTSAGPVSVKAGAVTIPTDLRRCKLFREHGRKNPVGYATGASETKTGLTMVFRAAATPDGDTALLEASEGVRDALSVELDNVKMDDKGNVTAADLSAVALVSIPAFADARLIAEDTDPDNTPNRHGDADDDNDDDDADDGDNNEGETNVGNTTITVDGGAGRGPVGAAMARRRGKGLSLDATMRRVVDKIGGSMDAATINAALSDVIPTDDTSNGAWIRPQWIDEIWTPVDIRRPYINSVSSGVLTGMKVFGWKWGARPVVGPYAGNKTAIPSNKIGFGPAEAPATRHAGGWDVDNIFVYLGDGSLLAAIFAAAAQDYGMKQEAAISAALVAEATAATAADVIDGLSVIASTLAGSGARPSFIGLAPDLWGAFSSISASDAPWWLSNSASSVNLTDGTSAAADLRVFVDPDLADGHMLGGDRRAVTHYEPRGNPFRVQAVNLPNGGVDIGLFGFDAVLVNDSRGIVDVTVGPVIP